MKHFFKISIFFIFQTIFCVCLFGADKKEESASFAFIAPAYSTPQTSAVYNGARDAAKELQARFGKKISMKFFSAENSASRQIKQLSGLYLEGFKGAVVFPVDGAADQISASAQTLAERGFYVAVVGAHVHSPALAANVSTNSKKTAETLAALIKKFSDGKKVSLLCYFHTDGAVQTLDLTESKIISKYLYPNLSFKEFSDVVAPLNPSKIVAMDYYSIYAKQHAVEISRYDNFGEVFFSPRLLEDVAPIKKDTDRRFAICVGALPQFAFYLANNSIDACIYDDFYGWGYVATRALLEKSFAQNPADISTYEKLLDPIVATPSTTTFVSDWKKWMFFPSE